MAQIPAYKACFRQAVKALRSMAPNVKIEWSHARKTVLPVEGYGGSWVTTV